VNRGEVTGGTMSAQTVAKILGLAMTYVLFEFTTKACEKPIAHCIAELQRRPLSDIIADAMAYLEEAGYSLMMRTPKQSKGALPDAREPPARQDAPGSAQPKKSVSAGSPKLKIPMSDLCDRCVDTFATVERLRRVAAEMQLPYPGDDAQPCSLCRDRALRLYDLERSVLLSPAKGKGVM